MIDRPNNRAVTIPERTRERETAKESPLSLGKES